MYLRMLKKDLKRKKTMNAIILVFITLATMFVSSSANNLITVTTALDEYFDMADVPDYFFNTLYEEEAERFRKFADENGYGLSTAKLIQIDPHDIMVSGEVFEYGNSVCVSSLGGTKIFDENGDEITHVKEGEIYVNSTIFHMEAYHFYDGCKIEIDSGGVKKEFTLKGYTKDAMFGSNMIGMTRFLLSDSEFREFDKENSTKFSSLLVYTDDSSFMEKYNDLSLQTTMNADRAMMKMMYMMDTLIAAVILIVSICLILISMVILRFTIHFTINGEFREIGVMKAIGIPNGKIRSLYILKYFAISTVGAAIGVFLSIPFGSLLIGSVSRNIIISGKNRYFLNLIFAMATAALVVLFCYLCTGKIKKFSPIDAIRNGETGERYSKKGFMRLSKSRLAPVPFMAFNDIFSGLKRYLSMILIFTLGLLLVIIPVNTINTLQSDKLITCFNMADCDIVISKETLFSSEDGKNEDMIFENLDGIKKFLHDNKIDADVFQEIMYRFMISHNGKKSSSLAFQGAGDVTADRYDYLFGTPPQNEKEVALSFVTADRIGAGIGDEVVIEMGSQKRTYTVTAINQSMNNLGEGIRFFQEDDIDSVLAAGSFGVQISYKDNPDKKTFQERKELLEREYPDSDIYSAGGYINYMIGDVAGQLESVKSLILAIIICINILVAVLMVRSFIAKEKGEIAMLKAIGFRNSFLVAWQSIRIGIVLLISIIIGTALSTPLSKITVEPVFRMMGLYSVRFEVVPMEVYVVYPLAVLCVTVLAAAVGALRLRKISASETSNIE